VGGLCFGELRMQIIAGLGNPGAGYANNRHNIGFLAVERIAERHGFGPWRARFQGLTSEGMVGRTKVLLLKPQTYMNESGRAVGEAARFFKVPVEDVTVIYDELDLAAGKLKVKRGGGAAGHNGIRSTDAHLGPEFRRVRLGIGHPGHKEKVTGHVLGDFSKADADWREPLLDAIAAEIQWLVDGDEARFATAVALRLAPPKETKD
jgi:peptidyl-tRNA hydrolase, PTH1 family